MKKFIFSWFISPIIQYLIWKKAASYYSYEVISIKCVHYQDYVWVVLISIYDDEPELFHLFGFFNLRKFNLQCIREVPPPDMLEKAIKEWGSEVSYAYKILQIVTDGPWCGDVFHIIKLNFPHYVTKTRTLDEAEVKGLQIFPDIKIY